VKLNVRPLVSATFLTLSLLGLPSTGIAQSLESLQIPAEPLVLKARGSFYVGGESIEQSRVELGGRGADDRITVNQMYVEYMVPEVRREWPVVMIHGAGLSGKSYDTTPDGRMGWFEYFARKYHAVYVVDQVGRARSGFNQALLNRVGAGEKPLTEFPRPWRFGDRRGVWTNFRFGPTFGEPFAQSLFPVDAVGELAKQSIPDLTPAVPTPNPTLKALSDLSLQLKGAVLLSHSQSGHFPMEAALLDPAGIRAIVAIEPGTCRGSQYTDEQIAKLAKVPTLIVYGDFLESPTQFTEVTWKDRFDDCNRYIERIKAASGHAEMLHTPAIGIRGNSHMLMHDRNHLQIADLLLKWIADHQPAEVSK
jgi:pimeloyl-ACP methyl ester carboxylesterase